MIPLGGTITVERHTSATPDQVWAVLADGWSYATWVVGASRLRHVEPHWPEVGQRLHHSFGVWPMVIDDSTEVLESVEPEKLTLRARGWPAGEAMVSISITPDPAGCRLRISEDASAGPGLLVPKPLRQLMIAPRNREALKRLAYLAEGRSQPALTD